jgi:tRNA A-37 threonylcarbamoyl transferase component Bud32
MTDTDDFTTQRRPRRSGGADPLVDERTDLDENKLPSPPLGVSRIDTLPEDFVKFLSRRPHFIGDVIHDRYKLVEHLGDGAMGQVFAAENLTIGRRVAVKVVKAELLADAQFRARFQREAEAIAAIDHRNVVRFLDLVIGDPVFLVMEFVRGPTLASVLRRHGRLDPIRAINIAARLCWGLDAAHRAGVVHRDIKPANVILSPDPELGEEPRLIDFGLAKLTRGPAESELTRTGQIIGTPHYMSPEQIANRLVDARSDLYSLGCLLYHMVTGKPPFQGDHDVQILYHQVKSEHASLREIAPHLPPDLDELLRRALAKDPERRFATAREMGKALGSVERRKRATAPASRDDERGAAATAWSTARVLTIGVALALAVAAGAFAISRVLSRRAAADTLLVVGSQPDGARVQIDDHALPDKTPAVARGLRPGKHVVRIFGAGTLSIEQIVNLAPGERTIIEPALPPATRRVLLQTIPPGALVYVDGRLLVGQTPLTAELSDDFHQIRFERTRYEDETRAIAPDDTREQITVHLDEERQPHGALWIRADRAAEVYLDGHDTGFSTPTIGIRAAVGEHVVEVRDAAGRSRSAKVSVAQGEAVHQSFVLDAVSQ